MPKLSLPVFAAGVLLLLIANLGFAAGTIAYSDPVYAGNQPWTGNLGLDFDVIRPIKVTALGVFDTNGDGFATAKSVGIFDRDTGTLVGTSCTLITGGGAPLVNGDRMCAVPAFILPPGHYSVVAVGFNQSDQNGTTAIPGYQVSVEDTGGGLIAFVGTGRYDANTSLGYPTLLAPGPTNIFNAGTFQFEAAPILGVTDSPYQIRYAANLNQGESYVNIINDGANGTSPYGPALPGATGNLCVNVYAFDPNEEMIACCSCAVTPDQVVNLGVNRDILSNTQTGVAPTSVTIKLLGTLAGTDSGSGLPGSSTTCQNSAATLNSAGVTVGRFVAGFVAFGTTLHAERNTYVTTETPFIPATLSANEITGLGNRCTGIIGNSSNHGICASCRQGALGASRM